MRTSFLKKTIVFLLLIIMTFSLSGCSYDTLSLIGSMKGYINKLEKKFVKPNNDKKEKKDKQDKENQDKAQRNGSKRNNSAKRT